MQIGSCTDDERRRRGRGLRSPCARWRGRCCSRRRGRAGLKARGGDRGPPCGLAYGQLAQGLGLALGEGYKQDGRKQRQPHGLTPAAAGIIAALH
ncbi:MAG: hypothetical protein WD690_08330 [Vicinamibacterales bacterium]